MTSAERIALEALRKIGGEDRYITTAEIAGKNRLSILTLQKLLRRLEKKGHIVLVNGEPGPETPKWRIKHG